MIAEPLRDLAVPLDQLRTLEGNPRRGDVRAVARSLERFGQRKPVVARADGTVIAGNHLLAAARELGWSELAVTRVDDDDATAKAFALADNRTAELGAFDLGDLAAMAADVYAVDPALLEAASYTEADLNALLAGVEVPAKLTDPDEVPEPPAEPVTRPGDLWLLGPHRLLCGDATVATDVERLLDGAAPPLMITDPPYGVDYDPDWRNERADKGQLAYAARRVGELKNDDRVDWSEAWALAPSDVAYCWFSDLHSSDARSSLEAVGYEIRCQVIWAKSNFPISRGHYHWRHEPCWYAVRKGATARWIGDHAQTTLWEINLDKNVEGGHSTQKPVECMARGLRNHSGDVYDPFVGSGSTLIAAHSLGRTCYAMDVDPAYVDVVARRYQEHTGTKPILEATGEPHDFTA